MSLREYNEKRDFRRTREPHGTYKGTVKGHSYLIQKHNASHLHYDFRLEHKGVLLSWAVPKGPSTQPGVRRLAMQVEDHPLEYGKFEGTIPQGEYGGGTVMLWDRGSWEPLDDVDEGLRRGKLSFILHGERMNGEWTLVRSHRGDGKRAMWFLIKKRERFAGRVHEEGGGGPDPVAEEMTSVKTGRTMDEIAGRVHLPKHFSPELATLVDEPPTGDDWVHEVKFDGYRIVTVIKDGHVRCFSRNDHDWTAKIPAIVEAVKRLKVKDAVLDGELVAPGPDGVSDFQSLQNAFKAKLQTPLIYWIFDIVKFKGQDLRKLPLIERKKILRGIFDRADLRADSQVRLSQHGIGNGLELWEQACRLGIEGIVSKKANSRYVSDRTSDWLKVKCLLRQEFVVVGYTEPEGTRTNFGALLLAAHDQDGNLRFVGRTGTGFTHRILTDLKTRLDKIKARGAPANFVDPENDLGSRRGITWVKPKLVAEVKFAQWTKGMILRQAVYQGLREDKKASDVVIESPRPVAAVEPEEAPGHQPARATLHRTSHGHYSRRLPVLPSERVLRGKAYRGPRREDRWLRENIERQGAQLVSITHADKVLFSPDITKADLADYYASIWKFTAPHLVNRPLAIVRCPNGHGKTCFFQKHRESRTLGRSESSFIFSGKDYMYVDSLEGLASLVQIGVLEIHMWGTHVQNLEKPDILVFDLDPDPSVKWDDMIETAFVIRDRLEKLRLKSFVKTTGGKGLHVVIPIKPERSWSDVRKFCRAFASALEQEFPGRYTSNMAKEKRSGKIFVDYLRNGRGSTSILPYSTRKRAHAPVAMPLTWREVETVSGSDAFTLHSVPQFLKKHGDPWPEFFKIKQCLPDFS